MKQHMVSSGDVELNVVEGGDPSRPAILFLHGFPDCHKVWRHQMDALAERYHVIAFDMRGSGESSGSAARDSYHMEKLLADVMAVIEATRGANGHVHLVGHDWGSVIGWYFVAHPHYRQRVISWTSMSGPHVGLLWDWVRRKMTSLRPGEMGKAASQFAHSWYIFAMQVPGLGRFLFGRFSERVWRQALRNGGVPADDPYLRADADEIRRLTLQPLKLYQQNALNNQTAPEKGSITTPTQLIVLRRDAFVRPQVFEYLDEYVTDLERTDLDANHWAIRSHPGEITALIERFVSRHEEPAVEKTV